MVELLTLIATIAAILVSAVITYHIAKRQGVFAKSNLYISFSPPAEKELPRVPVQAILVAVPLSSPRHLVVGLPLVLQNRGAVAIRNLWLNLEYARGLAVNANPAVVSITGPLRWPDSTRNEHLSEEVARVNHELPVIRPGETMVLSEPLVFDTRELSSSYKAFPIFLQSIAENAPRRKGYVQVAFVRANDLNELQSQFSPVIHGLESEEGAFVASMMTVLVSRLFRKVIRNIQCLLIVPDLKISGSVAVDESLFGNSGTGYQTAEAGIYIKELPSGRPISRREAKELQNSRRDRFQ